MADELRESITHTSQLDENLRDVARSMGLSEREAADFARQMRRVEDAAEDTSTAILRVGTRGASAFTSLRGTLLGVGAGFAVVAGARGFLNFAGDAITAASDLEESTSKAGIVFGEFSDEIRIFGETAPQSLGLANREALEFAGTFGNLFQALGLTQEASADLSQDIIILGSDLSSFNNIPVTEALDKLRAGLVGEAEPLRALGVNLNESIVQAKAAELGFVGLNDELTEAEKVQSRYALIVEQTALAQGDFARTSDSTANQMKTLNAEFQTFLTESGEALLPAFRTLLDIAPGLLDNLKLLVPVLGDLAVDFAEAAGGADGFARKLAGLPSAIGAAFATIGSTVSLLKNVGDAGLFLLTFNIPGAIQEIGDAVKDVRNIDFQGKLNKSIQNFFTTVAGGVEPVEALESVLVDLSDSGLDPTQLAAIATELAEISGVDTVGIVGLAGLLREAGVSSGFSEPEVRALHDAILAVLDLGSGGGRNVRDRRMRLIDPEPTVAAVDEIVESFNLLDIIDPELDLTGLSAAEAELATFKDIVDTILGDVSESFDATSSDFTTFLADFRANTLAGLRFQAGVDVVEALFGPNAAAAFITLGDEALPLLEDALDNPEELGAFRAMLDDITKDGILTGAATAQDILNENPLLVTIQGQLDRSQFLTELNDFGANFKLTVPVVPSGTSAPSGGGVPPQITVNIPPSGDSATDAARTAQTVASIFRI